MKFVLSFLSVCLFAAAAFADAPVRVVIPPRPPMPLPVPRPGSLVEQFVMRELNQQFGASVQYLPLTRALALPERAIVNSVVLVVSSDDGRGMVSVTLGRQQLLPNRYVGTRLEVIQVPVNAFANGRHELGFQATGSVLLKAVGATYEASFAPPAPSAPKCELMGPGTYNNFSWNYRIGVNGAVMAAADKLEDALSKMRELERANVCAIEGYAPAACTLVGYGTFRNFSWNYRLKFGNELLGAADRWDDYTRFVNTLVGAKLCEVVPQGQCKLLPAGTFRNFSWNYRVAVENEVVDAYDKLGDATARMEQLRQSGFCY